VEGAGLKARRLSSQLPADFHVDTCELDLEFVSASKIGRRKEVGRGATATVKIMVRKGEPKGPQYAVKEFRKRSPKEDEAEYVQKVVSEFSIANSLHHPNIVKTVRLCTHAGRWDHVMEYCQLGELFSLVERKYLKQEDKVCFFKQLVRGVAYLHDHGIAHRDIKLENLLLNDQGHVKITDFGVSEVFCGEHPGLRSSAGECGKNMKECRKSAPGICGSMPYIAPEVLAKKGEYDPRPLDIWSCAILYIALVHGGNVWQQADKSDAQYRPLAEGWEEFLKQDPDRAIDESNMPDCGRVIDLLPTSGQRRLILRMLHPDPEKRITIREVLKNPWVKRIECCCPDDESSDTEAPIGIDVAQKGSCKIAKKLKVLKKHDHLPPPVKRLPQHKFDMGDGTSRYD
jgi:protein-serine/threonine kinase